MQSNAMVHMLALLLALPVGFGLSGLKAHGQTPSLPIGEPHIGAADTSGERLGEMLSREQAPQEQMQVEDRTYEERLQALEDAVRKVETRLDKAPAWWLPIIVSAVLAFIFSSLAVHRDRKRAVSDKLFARSTFPAFESSLTQVLDKHVNEIDTANRLVHDVFETPLLSSSDDDGFQEKLWADGLMDLKLSHINVAAPSEGKHFTGDLVKQISLYEKKTSALNQMLHEFSLLSRVSTVFTQSDQYTLSQYRERLLAEYGVEYTRELVALPAFQTKANDLKGNIARAAQEVKKQNEVLRDTLARIRELVRGV